MLIADSSTHATLFVAAALVHGSVSVFWAMVAGAVLPRRHTTWWAIALAVAIGWLDLRVIAPRWFPGIEALAFWPQMADHMMWGACLGLALQVQGARHPRPAA